MNFNIRTYNGKTTELRKNETVFYVQSHGLRAGRPIKEPIPNCWEVRTDRSIDFEILYIIFESRILEPFIRGSVIPFISLVEYRKIITPILKNAIHENRIINEHYLQIRKIEAQQGHQNKVRELLQTMKIAISKECYNKIKTVK
ncbi:DUF6943 family protein [Epilithonimonas pallida]|uniref:Uncharacterized protein n=1 Tax=Epilithonimonas pallida TaxID=373671 RepID=A0ABY1R4T8_9FLAO|nr:hypothetical protein [Epilithonimonas pallida]SMP94718.1 hypothetical protein SAMN05421679_106117 [Epilithonimonas pallida]